MGIEHPQTKNDILDRQHFNTLAQPGKLLHTRVHRTCGDVRFLEVIPRQASTVCLDDRDRICSLLSLPKTVLDIGVR